MAILVRKTHSGVREAGAGVYLSDTDDPRFVYRFWVRRPRYMVVLLQGLDGSLDPKIYVDRGNGFDEADAMALQHDGVCIYSISVTMPRRVRRIRIDPCSGEGRFRYWAGFAWTEDEKTALLARAQRDNDGQASVYDIVIDGAPEKREKRKSAKSVAQHYAEVIALARRTVPPVDPDLTKDGPLISFVVPVYDTPEAYLDDLLSSFRDQPAGSAELILCDDGSTSPRTLAWLDRHQGHPDIRILRERNRGIALATNSGIEIARGQWVGLVDHDDALSPGAVQLIARTVQDHPDCKFIYTDEVVTDKKLKPVAYHLKPAYDEVLHSGVNYINHLSCYRRDRLLALGGLRPGYDGSQDYDLLLRYLRGLAPGEIKHIPYPAYLWRRTPTTFSARFMDRATKGARKSLTERYTCGEKAPQVDGAITTTLHRLRFDKLPRRWPRVSVVIPNRDSFPLIARLLADLTVKTDYPDLEIIVIDNGTTDPRVVALYAEVKRGPLPFIAEIEPAPFNFSRQVNRGMSLATGELVLLLNNDIEVLEGVWLREMVCCFDYPNTGIVGARLVYPGGRLQHAGVIVGLGGLAGHWFCGQRQSQPGPMARLHVRQSLTAVTGACMLISRECLKAVGDFDEKDFGVAYNDIDFCLRAVAAGYRVVWTPFATLVHYESASRGSDESEANRDRFARDKEMLRQRHGTGSYEDRAFSPWYNRDYSDLRPALLAELPKAR
jgi:O-antigen biosynthesis protein